MKLNPRNLIFDINKFKEIKQIGKGTSGHVYLVENEDTKQLYAIKIIQIDEFGGEDLSLYLNSEISIMSRIHHLFMVQFYGYNISNSEGKIVGSILMQYCAKDSLKTILSELNHDKQITGYNNTTKQKLLIGLERAM